MSIQEEIINHKDGALLVTASAGSGKTRVLTERIKKAIADT
jgi:DNA helicase II / ATP-dependent DNA helicase PcrA